MLLRMVSRASPTKLPPKAALARLVQIHERLREASQVGERVNCLTLARDLEVSEKTIYRDLTFLRDRWELPIEYDFTERSYGYTREDVSLPLGRDLTFDERIALAVARQSLDVFEGASFAKQVQSALEKLTGGLLPESGSTFEPGLDRFISVRTPGAGRVDPKVFRAVCLALLRQRELRAGYQARGRTEATPHTLQALHLACIESRWVLVARNAADDIRTYVLTRFRDPVVTRNRFQRPHGFRPEDYLGTAFGAWTGTGTIKVRARIARDGAHHVLERNWHPTQQVTTLADGGVEVCFALSDLNDVTRWLLGFGADVEVLDPPELRSRLADEGRRMAARNS